MQEHDKTILTLFMVGAMIGLAKLLVSDERITPRIVIGRTILGSASSAVAGIVLIQIPDLDKIALIGLASAIGIAGSSFIEMLIINKFRG